EDVAAVEEQRRRARAMQFQHAEVQSAVGGDAPAGDQPPAQAPPPVTTFVREGRKVGRNEPCPCGSGLKYKQCHGRLS
ncbi:MAG: SEC-C domain-containing protein, partial [Gammaproteobacteria bacterium]|nr:SEC-C domain-containing protein [Gammaproteobacteria bacterium]